MLTGDNPLLEAGNIGHIRLKDLTPLHIQAFYRNLQEEWIRQHTTATVTPALAEWMTQQHLSQSAFAKKADITHQTVSQALKGSNINLASAEKMAAAVGVDVKELFTVNTDTTPLAPPRSVRTTAPFPPFWRGPSNGSAYPATQRKGRTCPRWPDTKPDTWTSQMPNGRCSCSRTSRSSGGHPLSSTCSPACAGRSCWACAGRT